MSMWWRPSTDLTPRQECAVIVVGWVWVVVEMVAMGALLWWQWPLH